MKGALPVADIHWHIEDAACLDSTQDTLKAWAEEGAPEGLVIQADSQRRGRGRHGREWMSPKGNLYMSLLLRPVCTAREIGQLSLVSALALAETLSEQLKDSGILTLKWPNDALLEGRKCAGLILETQISAGGKVEWLVIGIGVNIAKTPLETGAYLEEFVKEPVSVVEIRDAFLTHFKRLYRCWQLDGFEPVRMAWLSYAHAPGTALSVKIGQRHRAGTFHALDEQGNLLLQVPGYGIQTITAGEIYLEL